MKIRWTILAAVLSTATAAWAGEQGAAAGEAASASRQSPVAQETAQIFKQIEGMKRLPANGLQAVKAGGRMLYVTDNGRFVFQGPVYDLWNRTYLNTLEDVERYADHIDFKKMGLKIDDIAMFDYGEGKEDVVVFVDPFCPYCGKLMKQMPSLKGKYRFRLVVIPVLGQRSQKAARNLSCYQGGEKAKGMEILMSQKGEEMLAQPQSAECDTATLQRALVTAKMLGVYGVPYIVGPGGKTQKGYVADLGAWLAPGDEDKAISMAGSAGK